jgi:hypothetical protein
MSWTEYWAPGIKFSYPTQFDFLKSDNNSNGSGSGQISTVISGDAVGIDPNTKEIITSFLKIEIYEPEFLNNDGSSYMYSPEGGRYSCTTTNSGLSWYEIKEDDVNDGLTAYNYYHVETFDDGSSRLYRIRFLSDNFKNYKVTNIMNWLIGSTKLTSY